MNRTHLMMMSLDDHRAAERDLSVLLGNMARFEGICQGRGPIPSRALTATKRIRRAIHKIYEEMRYVLERTLIEEEELNPCWQVHAEPTALTSTRQRAVFMTMENHSAAARELGRAKRAVGRFLQLINNRRHLPVRIMDMALRIDDRLELIRRAMDDLQFMTLRGDASCWFGLSNFVDGNDVGVRDQSKATSEPGL